MSDWIALLVGVALTAGTAIFVASEFSLVTLDAALIENKRADRRTRTVLASLKRLSTELSASQVGITVTTILLGYIAQPALARLLRGVFDSWAIATTVSITLATALALALINVFSMLFGELVPKNYALAAPLTTARIVVPIQRVFSICFRPLIALLDGSANAILRRFGVEPAEELSGARSGPELAALVRRSAAMGTLDGSTARLLTNSIELDELSAVDVMTDRTRMVTVDMSATAADIVVLARNTGHSRFPVIAESRDDIVGLVQLRRVLAVPRERRSHVLVTGLMDEARQVPETVALRSLLVGLRELGSQMAVVVDEYGGTSGIVTLEDVVEEIVGDVADEHDARRLSIVGQDEGTWLVAGLARPDEVFEATGVELPESPAYETVAGLIMAQLGRVAQVGDTVTVDSGRAGERAQLHVEAMAARRIVQVRMRRLAAPVAAEERERG
ncbi:hemolysin family protein [Rarobacter faecitabidus]|uniref:CBS domain containing-hemolysin-like protein n=1 Tax=Rarobacter faecitabidus TaxID=13243 RepID=A0A542ZX94_RARFA|nr:hemolysin family protein [Rarobacter faecitabidus]TQL64968.1 CBS domain containing-hemolysin-like protein [Rarobacter faecitabidus]